MLKNQSKQARVMFIATCVMNEMPFNMFVDGLNDGTVTGIYHYKLNVHSECTVGNLEECLLHGCLQL